MMSVVHLHRRCVCLKTFIRTSAIRVWRYINRFHERRVFNSLFKVSGFRDIKWLSVSWLSIHGQTLPMGGGVKPIDSKAGSEVKVINAWEWGRGEQVTCADRSNIIKDSVRGDSSSIRSPSAFVFSDRLLSSSFEFFSRSSFIAALYHSRTWTIYSGVAWGPKGATLNFGGAKFSGKAQLTKRIGLHIK